MQITDRYFRMIEWPEVKQNNKNMLLTTNGMGIVINTADINGNLSIITKIQISTSL